MACYGKHFFDQCLGALIYELARNEEEHPEWPEDAASAARIVLREAQRLADAATSSGRQCVGGDSDVIRQAVLTGTLSLRLLLNAGDTGGYLFQTPQVQECLAMEFYEGGC